MSGDAIRDVFIRLNVQAGQMPNVADMAKAASGIQDQFRDLSETIRSVKNDIVDAQKNIQQMGQGTAALSQLGTDLQRLAANARSFGQAIGEVDMSQFALTGNLEEMIGQFNQLVTGARTFADVENQLFQIFEEVNAVANEAGQQMSMTWEQFSDNAREALGHEIRLRDKYEEKLKTLVDQKGAYEEIIEVADLLAAQQARLVSTSKEESEAIIKGYRDAANAMIQMKQAKDDAGRESAGVLGELEEDSMRSKVETLGDMAQGVGRLGMAMKLLNVDSQNMEAVLGGLTQFHGTLQMFESVDKGFDKATRSLQGVIESGREAAEVLAGDGADSLTSAERALAEKMVADGEKYEELADMIGGLGTAVTIAGVAFAAASTAWAIIDSFHDAAWAEWAEGIIKASEGVALMNNEMQALAQSTQTVNDLKKEQMDIADKIAGDDGKSDAERANDSMKRSAMAEEKAKADAVAQLSSMRTEKSKEAVEAAKEEAQRRIDGSFMWHINEYIPSETGKLEQKQIDEAARRRGRAESLASENSFLGYLEDAIKEGNYDKVPELLQGVQSQYGTQTRVKAESAVSQSLIGISKAAQGELSAQEGFLGKSEADLKEIEKKKAELTKGFDVEAQRQSALQQADSERRSQGQGSFASELGYIRDGDINSQRQFFGQVDQFLSDDQKKEVQGSLGSGKSAKELLKTYLEDAADTTEEQEEMDQALAELKNNEAKLQQTIESIKSTITSFNQRLESVASLASQLEQSMTEQQ